MRSMVRSDGNEVGQSRAVGMAREVLAGAGGASAGGILSSSPRERERRKSVKFAKTDRGREG